jgi:hypothetical protein
MNVDTYLSFWKVGFQQLDMNKSSTQIEIQFNENDYIEINCTPEEAIKLADQIKNEATKFINKFR